MGLAWGIPHNFGLFSLGFCILFILALALLLAALLRGLRQWSRNNQSPRLTVEALVVAKRQSLCRQPHPAAGDYGRNGGYSTNYYATFQVESGDRMELSLPGREYGLLAEGDRGRLSFQGSRFLGFERLSP